MTKTPRSLIELFATFRTEEDCRHALFRHRWPDGFACPRCGGDHAYPIANRSTYECSACGHQTSVTAGTIFHKTRTGPRESPTNTSAATRAGPEA